MTLVRIVFLWLCGLSVLAQGLFYGGAAPASAAPVTEISYQAYAVGYSEATRTPLWSVYEVTQGAAKGPAPRHGAAYFTEYRTASRVSPGAYRHTGFSRGHMTPFAAISRGFGPFQAEETLSMANIAPQLQSFNAGIWSRLEAAVDGRGGPGHFRPGLTQGASTIWVYTGPVFAPDLPAKRISAQDIEVPTAFWKVAIWLTASGQAHACAWIIPHAGGLGSRTFMVYATTPREVEREAHVTLVPGDQQGVMEREDAAEVPQP